MPWKREPWAVAAGRDGFGLWAAIHLRGVTQRFRWIPPGRFRMGSPEGEAGRSDGEGPQHMVTWTKGRWLADTPVTQALYEAVMDKNPSRFKSPDRPVEQVSLEDCKVFIKELNKLVPELAVRLPSEAEWEHACRAGTETATWLGDLKIVGENNAPSLNPIAWYGGNSGVEFELSEYVDSSGWPNKQYDHVRAGTRGVATKAPNPLGMYDMLGNVFEWCMDFWGTYTPEDKVNPAAYDRSGSVRVFRGGSWFSGARFVRAAFRSAYAPGDRDAHLGFRVARDPAPGRGKAK
ncbi:MAG: formylglycine-generating enzyme family protein [Polyangiaceae bacterium]|nr:formylglycine-generating enzyme family protein [Polyangiaceae bacterium]